MPIDHSLPLEMRDLLIRLDTKVDGLIATISRIDKRADNHEQRLQKVELTLADRPAYIKRFEDCEHRVDAAEDRLDAIDTAAKTTKMIAGGLWMLGGGGVITMIGVLIKLAITGTV